MVYYRRLKIPGGLYFFTVALLDRKATYLVDYISLLTKAMRDTREGMPFETLAMVVLPDHLHTMWQLPEGDDNFPMRWMKIKRKFTKSLVRAGVPIRKNHLGEYNLWQRRFWEHALRDDIDYENHANYIHYNPVKHRYVRRVRDWPYSTFHRYVEKGIYPVGWGDYFFEGAKFDLGEVE